MAADYNTNIVFKGNCEKALDILEDMANDTQEIYFLSVDVYEKPFAEEKTYEVEAQGPYGLFGDLDETFVFESIAEASPKCSFVGYMDGFDNGQYQIAKGFLKKVCYICFLNTWMKKT